MLKIFTSLFSTPARAYAFLFAILLLITFIVYLRANFLFKRYIENAKKEFLETGKVSLIKRILLIGRKIEPVEIKRKVKKVMIEGTEIEVPEEEIERLKQIVGERADEIAMEMKSRQKLETKKTRSVADMRKLSKAREEALKREKKEIERNEEELQGLRDEGKRVMEEMAEKIAEYENNYQNLEQIEDILSYKDDIKDVDDIKERSDLDKLLDRQGSLESTFDWHKGKDMTDIEISGGREVALSEEQIKGFLDNMMSEMIPLVDRGLSDSQITRTLANKNQYQIPSHELVPMLEAVRDCLGILDSRSTSAKNRFTDASYDIAAARSALLRGEPRDAIKIMEDRMKLLEKTADSMENGKEKDEMLEKAADLSRHLAVLVKVSNIKDSFKYIHHSIDLDRLNIKSLSILGHMNLRDNDLFSAERAFLKALENSNSNEFWANIAKDGMEKVKALKEEEQKSTQKGMEKEANKIRDSVSASRGMYDGNQSQNGGNKQNASMYRLVIRVKESQNTR